MQLGMRVDGTVNNIFVISKHVSFLVGGYTKVSNSITQINNLFHTGMGKNKLRSIC